MNTRTSPSLYISSKSIADLRPGLSPFSHSELHVSHYGHISTLYFANPCLLIKGQRASKKKCSSALTVNERLLKVTRALLTGPMPSGQGRGAQRCLTGSRENPPLEGSGPSVIATFIKSSWVSTVIKWEKTQGAGRGWESGRPLAIVADRMRYFVLAYGNTNHWWEMGEG